MQGWCSHPPLHKQLECQNSQFTTGLTLLHKVRKRLFCDSSRVTLPSTAASLVSCSTKTTESLSPVCSCTQPKHSVSAPLASLCLCQCWALLARGRVWNHRHCVCFLPFPAPLFPPGPAGAETPSAPMGSLGEAGQDSCSSSLGWRRGCKVNKPGEIFSHC